MGLDVLLENQLCHLPKFHIYSLSNPGVEIKLIFTLQAALSQIRANFSKLPYLGMKFVHCPKLPEVAHIRCFYPKGAKLTLFLLYAQRFPSIRPGYKGSFSKLPYLGMKLGHWPKFQKLRIHSLYYPRVPNSLRFLLQLAICKILALLHFPIGDNVKFQSCFLI